MRKTHHTLKVIQTGDVLLHFRDASSLLLFRLLSNVAEPREVVRVRTGMKMPATDLISASLSRSFCFSSCMYARDCLTA